MSEGHFQGCLFRGNGGVGEKTGPFLTSLMVYPLLLFPLNGSIHF